MSPSVGLSILAFIVGLGMVFVGELLNAYSSRKYTPGHEFSEPLAATSLVLGIIVEAGGIGLCFASGVVFIQALA